MIMWSELRNCNIADVAGYINEKLEDLKSLNKVAEQLKVNESTIRKFFKSKQYKRVGNLFVPLDDICNQECNHVKKRVDDTCNIDVINCDDSMNTSLITRSVQENMMYISSEIDTLKNVIDWFKNKDNDNSNTGVIELIEGIKIDLPESTIKRTTIRINEKIWNQFNELVEENKPLDKHDIMSMALKEYIEKYKK